MSDALAPTAPVVTADQMTLVKQTVAAGATEAELKLYLYDCVRQGVHPLDRLLHFTKRGGKYTPVTSIDLMRIRAADTGEYAGNDDAIFKSDDHSGPPDSATITVWRLVQQQRYGFTATARWTEYCPPSGQDHMWRKMPYTMIAKCAEALALRKGFPRQLAGLYAREEMDQAGPDLPSTPEPAKSVKQPQNSTAPNAQTPAPVTGDTISAAQQKRLWAIARSRQWRESEVKEWLADLWNYDSTAAIKREHYQAICEQLGADRESAGQHE
jgi:phage recombination protein Bet